MANCGDSLVLNRPSASSTTCVAGCGDSSGLSATDPLNKNQLGARRNREKVREQIKDHVIFMLGGPSISLELTDQALDHCVDRALQIYEEYAGAEHFSYYTFRTIPGKSVYEMPAEVGLIRSVHYRETGQFGFQASDLDGAIPIEYFYPGGAYSSIQGGLIDPTQPIWGRMGEWVLYKQYEQMFSRVSSSLGGWEWIGSTRTIKVYPTPLGGRNGLVIVRYIQTLKDWNRVTEAMQDGALAHAKIMLGNIRGKYTNTPGPGQGMQLDGEYQRQSGEEMLKQWKEDLIYRHGDILPIRMD